MLTSPNSARRAVHARLSPIEIWQKLLAYLLDRHYGLTLNDTPFGDNNVIQANIDAGIALCDAVNLIVEKYALVRIDRRGFSAKTQLPFINRIDILRARKATGLMTRNAYKAVNNITNGKYLEEQP